MIRPRHGGAELLLPALEAQVQLEPRRIGIPGAGRIVAPVTAKTRCRTKPAERVLDR